MNAIKRALGTRQVQLALVVAVVLVLIFVSRFSAPQPDGAAVQAPPPSVAPAADQSATADAPAPANIAPSKAKALPDVVEQYAASGYRFQFADCRGTPGSLVIKKGKSYLLDNRDEAAHTFKVEGRSYRVNAYGYAIATARGIGTHMITCDGGGSAQIVVQP